MDEDNCHQLMWCVSDTVLHRFSNMLRFCWVLLSALLDSLTAWLSGLCQEHIDISTVLRIERCMLLQQAKQVRTITRVGITTKMANSRVVTDFVLVFLFRVTFPPER